MVEESCKWIMFYKIAYNSNEFDEIYDMIVYSIFVSLGFAFIENLLYVYGNGITTGIMRTILAVLGHACFGVFMGYYLGLVKQSYWNNRKNLSIKYVLLSIIISIIMHGIYDYCLFTSNFIFIIIFLTFVIVAYVFSAKKIKRMSSINRKMRYKDNYCPICGRQNN